MALDHGYLNIPLAKRGDLNAQVDRSLAEEKRSTAARLKAARTRHRDAFALAKSAIAAVSDERMAELGKPHGLTIKQTRAQFIAAANMNPERLAKSMQRELAPAKTCGNCADWLGGACWSGDRLDGDLSQGPAACTDQNNTCEAWRAALQSQAPPSPVEQKEG